MIVWFMLLWLEGDSFGWFIIFVFWFCFYDHMDPEYRSVLCFLFYDMKNSLAFYATKWSL